MTSDHLPVTDPVPGSKKTTADNTPFLFQIAYSSVVLTLEFGSKSLESLLKGLIPEPKPQDSDLAGLEGGRSIFCDSAGGGGRGGDLPTRLGETLL